MGTAELDRFVPLSTAARNLLRAAVERLGLSARGHDAIRKVARTVADLDGADRVEEGHLAEAVLYRPPSPVGAERGTLPAGPVPRTQ
jgi:magnesium chelatase family protein